MLGTGPREPTGEDSRAQANPQAGDANYRKWLSRQQRIWRQANTSQDFESWLEERHRPNLDDRAWDDYQAHTRTRQVRAAYYTRSRTGRVNRVG